MTPVQPSRSPRSDPTTATLVAFVLLLIAGVVLAVVLAYWPE